MASKKNKRRRTYEATILGVTAALTVSGAAFWAASPSDGPDGPEIVKFRLTNDNGAMRIAVAELGPDTGQHAIGQVGVIGGELQFEAWTQIDGRLQGWIYGLPAGSESNVYAEATAAMKDAMDRRHRMRATRASMWLREDSDMWWSTPQVRAILESWPCGRFVRRR